MKHFTYALTTIACMATSAIAQEAVVHDLGGTREATGAGEELDFIMEILGELNPQSIEINKEICGYIGYNRLGELVHTRNMIGEEASCWLPQWPTKMVVVASYHTHSTYSPEYDSEIPSLTDYESDEASGIDGYVATPGGRLWYIDTDAERVSQICGVGCLPADPNFIDEPKGRIRESYSLRALYKRAGN
ncbi:DUF4329 domain-containing protein [Aestuariibius sp. HNIBRBA575]|uniref:DUF4329 domain-containing protein n=1 Tax=Aestuariibius sp. HNIBRBA575 TaxID=3233343 RepID=UPI0034A598E1